MTTTVDNLLALRAALEAEAPNLIRESYFEDVEDPMTGCACAVGMAIRMLPENERENAFHDLRQPYGKNPSSNQTDICTCGLRTVRGDLSRHFGTNWDFWSYLQHANDERYPDIENVLELIDRTLVGTPDTETP